MSAVDSATFNDAQAIHQGARSWPSGHWSILLALAILGTISLYVLDYVVDPHSSISRRAVVYDAQNQLYLQCKERLIARAKGITPAAPGARGTANPTETAIKSAEFQNKIDQECGSLESSPMVAFIAYLISSGGGMYGLYRFLRLAMLGLFIACVIELMLRALKVVGMPVVSFEDLIKHTKDAAPPSDQRAGGANPPALSFKSFVENFGLPKLVSTLLLSTMTTSVVLLPELKAQPAIPTAQNGEQPVDAHRTIAASLQRISDLQQRLNDRFTTFADKDVKDLVAEATQQIAKGGERLRREMAAVQQTVEDTRSIAKDALEKTNVALKTSQDIKKDTLPTAAAASQIKDTLLPRLENNVVGKIAGSEDTINKKITDARKDVGGKVETVSVALDSVSGALDKVEKYLRARDRAATNRQSAVINYHKEVEEGPWWNFLNPYTKQRVKLLDDGLERSTNNVDQERDLQ